MILVTPGHDARPGSPTHAFERETPSGAWVTACGRRFDLIPTFKSGPAPTCRRCLGRLDRA